VRRGLAPRNRSSWGDVSTIHAEHGESTRPRSATADVPGIPPGAADGEDIAGLAGLPAQLHTPVSADDLEFDAAVIVDPERIRAHNPADLYVTMTRTTQRLGRWSARAS
jgi:hypothetical protein